MALHSPITRADEWHRWESKKFRVPCTGSNGEPINLTPAVLEWQLSRSPSSATLILITNSQFLPEETSPGSSVADVAVWEVDEVASGALQDGWYYHELWDRDSDSLLAYGGALLLPGRSAAP